MVVPARPRAPFEVIDAEFVLQFAIVLLNAPPAFREAHEPPEAERLAGQLGQPILRGRRLALRPFDQQADRGALGSGVRRPLVGGPDRGVGKPRAERPFGAGAPRHGAPRAGLKRRGNFVERQRLR